MPRPASEAGGTSSPRPRRHFRLPRRTVQLRLALLYAGFFLVCGIAVFLVPVFTFRSSQSASSAHGYTSPAPAHPRSAIPALAGGPDVQAQELRAIAVLAALVVASLAVGWMISGRLLRPLRTITSTARDISASNLNRRLALRGKDDEFRELAETLDDLFGRLEASFESQRHFVANASHELRTPLTAERALIQVALADPDSTAEALRATCRELLTLSDQQERLIDSLLTLASSERGIEQREPFDLAGIAGKVLADRWQQAQRRGIRLEAALGSAQADGDPSLAESLVTNLIDNALRYNTAGGEVRVATATADSRACLRVTNTGPLVPPDDVDRLFQPFQRLGAERLRHGAGHGLGLAIVRAIAEVHGASLTTLARPEGGLDIEVSFAPRFP
jgi:signal transduction histidine kinase